MRPYMIAAVIALAGCTPIPIYKSAAGVDTAHIALSFQDQSILAGVAMISRIEGKITCGEPLPNLQRMIVISKGNPLITDVNREGVHIPANKRFTLVATGLNDGFSACGRVISFLPNAGSRYEIAMTNTTVRQSGAAPAACPIGLVEVLPDDSGRKPVEVVYEECQPAK